MPHIDKLEQLILHEIVVSNLTAIKDLFDFYPEITAEVKNKFVNIMTAYKGDKQTQNSALVHYNRLPKNLKDALFNHAYTFVKTIDRLARFFPIIWTKFIAQIKQNPQQGYRLIAHHLLMIMKDPHLTLQMIDADFKVNSISRSERLIELINILFTLGARISLNDLLSKDEDPALKSTLIKMYLLILDKRGGAIQLDEDMLKLIKFEIVDIEEFWNTANIYLIELMLKSITSGEDPTYLKFHLKLLNISLLNFEFRNISLTEAQYIYQLLGHYLDNEKDKNESLWHQCNTTMMILLRDFNQLRYVATDNPIEKLLLDTALDEVSKNPGMSFSALESHLISILPADVSIERFANILKSISNWHAVFIRDHKSVFELLGKGKGITRFTDALIDIQSLLISERGNRSQKTNLSVSQTNDYALTVRMYFNLLNSYNISNVEWLSYLLNAPDKVINEIYIDKLFQN